MITFETIDKLEQATLKEGDLVQVLGEFSEGDVALMTRTNASEIDVGTLHMKVVKILGMY